MKIIFFTIFLSTLLRASGSLERVSSIFADPGIAERVAKQKHLEEQWNMVKNENPIVLFCLCKIISQQNNDALVEIKKSFATTQSVQERNDVLDAMAKWIVQNSDQSKSLNYLHKFAKKQEDKKIWLVMYCSDCPVYQRKVMRNIQKFESFKRCNFDDYLNNAK